MKTTTTLKLLATVSLMTAAFAVQAADFDRNQGTLRQVTTASPGIPAIFVQEAPANGRAIRYATAQSAAVAPMNGAVVIRATSQPVRRDSFDRSHAFDNSRFDNSRFDNRRFNAPRPAVVTRMPAYVERPVYVAAPVYSSAPAYYPEHAPSYYPEAGPAYYPEPVPTAYPAYPAYEERGPNVAGAVAGAAIGGAIGNIIGSQVGHGPERGIATAIGAILGGLIGSGF